MIQLLSKAQYKRSEKGEFHHIAHRTVEETISLIRSYPWKTERSLASVELTCPSITIEHPIGTYLKIGPYFSGKYSLYYLTTNKKVYYKTVDTLEDVDKWVKVYFEQEGTLDGLKKYSFTINPGSHFETDTFEYLTDTKASIKFFTLPVTIVLISIVLFGLRFIGQPNASGILHFIGVILSFFLILFSPLIFLYFNYLSADRDYYLQISKGHEEFIYGTKDNKKLYKKQDITSINTYVTPSHKSPWRECEVFIITFKDGEQLRFTSLLISNATLRNKFPDIPVNENNKFFPTVESIE